MLLESACNCINLNRATCIILIIRIPAFITYAFTLFEGESIVNPTIFHGLTAVTPSFVSSSFERVMFSFALYSWYILLLMGSPSGLSESSLVLASRLLRLQDCNATKLTNLWLLMSCLERQRRLQPHKSHEPVGLASCLECLYPHNTCPASYSTQTLYY